MEISYWLFAVARERKTEARKGDYKESPFIEERADLQGDSFGYAGEEREKGANNIVYNISII